MGGNAGRKIHWEKPNDTLMRVCIIIAGFLFTIGNILAVPLQEDKLYFVPLGFMLAFVFQFVLNDCKESSRVTIYLLSFFMALALGNIVKQITYSKTFEPYGDYVWGGTALLILLIVIYRWEIHKRRYGKKSHKV